MTRPLGAGGLNGMGGATGAGRNGCGALLSGLHVRVCAAGGKPATTTRADGGVPMSSLSEVRFLTVAEVAAVMRVSKMTVYRLVHAGDLASVRVGRSFRVPERAVHEYLRGAFDDVG